MHLYIIVVYLSFQLRKERQENKSDRGTDRPKGTVNLVPFFFSFSTMVPNLVVDMVHSELGGRDLACARLCYYIPLLCSGIDQACVLVSTV